jgi:glycosyltransferase involved in cell wall biosynthesis
MKVCLIGPLPPFRGGIAKYCYSLAQALEKRHDLLLVSYRRQYPALLYGRKSQVDPEVDRSEITRQFAAPSYDLDSANPASWSATARRIASFRPDLVILPWWVTYWAPMYLYLLRLFGKQGIPVLFLCINVFEHEDSALKKFLTKLVLKRARSVILHSEQERLQFLSFNPAARVEKHLLPLFEYRPAPARPKTSTLRLLFFGFVRPYKGLDTLLRALALVKEREVTLRVAGEFWKDKEEYLRLVDELGLGDRVEIIDRYVSDAEMSGYFAESDVVVLPYKRSITSGVIATAYGFGKPVLATRVGGFHEVIQDGYTGRMVAPDDPAALAQGVIWFLEHRDTDFQGNIGDFASRAMSWESLVRLIESF